MSSYLEIEEYLIDKTTNTFTGTPEFAECVALMHKFSNLHNLSLFTYVELELALQQEAVAAQNMHNKDIITRSPLLENFIAEQLHFFGKKFDNTNMYKKLYWALVGLNMWCVPKFDTRLLLPPKEEPICENKDKNGSELEQNGEIDMKMEDEGGSINEELSNATMSSEQSSNDTRQAPQIPIQSNPNGGSIVRRKQPADMADILYMTSEQKLKLMCFLLDAQLGCAEYSGNLDQEFSPEAQRIQPLIIDSVGRKFWYFCDTWLFVEDGQLFNAAEEEEASRILQAKFAAEIKQQQKARDNKIKGNKKEKLTKKHSNESVNNTATMKLTQRNLDETYSSLFTGQRLRVVCKCSEHFVALIEAYKNQRNMKQNNLEVIEKLEQCLQKVREIEQERLLKLAEEQKRSASPARHSSRIAGILEKRRLEEEERRKKQLAFVDKRKQLELEQAEFLREHRRLTDSNLRLSTMSREDRLKLRKQRIQEQLDRNELIAAGLLTPSPSTVTENDEEEETMECENGSIGANGGRKRRQQFPHVKILKKFSRNEDGSAESGGQLKVPRISAMDWWTPITVPSSNGPIGGNGTFESLFRRKSPMKSHYALRPAPPPNRIFADQDGSPPRTSRRSLIATSSSSSSNRFTQSHILKLSDFHLPANFNKSTETPPSTSSRYIGNLAANCRTNQQPTGLALKHGDGFDGIRAALNLRAFATNPIPSHQFPTTSVPLYNNNSTNMAYSMRVTLSTPSTTQTNNFSTRNIQWAEMNPTILLSSQCKYKKTSLADSVTTRTDSNNKEPNPTTASINELDVGNENSKLDYIAPTSSYSSTLS